jgi:hypothetical protein
MVLASLALITFAVARVTHWVTSDKNTLWFRRWVINRWGEDSNFAYLVHCSWCSSIWIAIPGGVGWAYAMLPMQQWWLALPAVLAMSYVAGLLSQFEEH